MAGPVTDRSRSITGAIRRKLAQRHHLRPIRRSLEQPMVSFTFDDIPLSAAHAGADILEAAGGRGTFYVSGALAEEVPGTSLRPHASWPDIRRIEERGHEIGCHSFDHWNCASPDANALAGTLARTRQAFDREGLAPAAAFAFPFGDASIASKRRLAPAFASARSVHAGLVEQGTDLFCLPAIAIEGTDPVSIATRWIEAAADKRAWLIFYSHDVEASPSPFGCTPEALEKIVLAAVRRGLAVTTVGDAVRRLG